MDPTGGEQARAVAETAKLGQQAADSFKKLLDPSLEALGAWAGSAIQARKADWELRHLQRYFDRVNEMKNFEVAQGERRMVSPRELAPLIDAVATEDDPVLVDLWARLLARATEPATGLTLYRA